ncbi:MAG TPA: LuxR C-terminal-related transcriptional regulator [Actinomycetota bacterium]|nr:LuxR C-terminal-related transcriptional regulator [Actinomycetota bacterium]
MWNLPARTTDVIGRAESIAEISRLLQTQRLVTLLGAPGSGKTTLALECARNEESRFPGGAWLVDLASVESPDAVLPMLAGLFGVGASPDPLSAVVGQVGLAPSLLVFDNCEHLVEAVARVSSACLTGNPRVVILATSRRALSVSGETLYDVEPLEVLGSVESPNLESPAVRLFTTRASARRSAPWTREDLEAAWGVCARVDGLPLAIELAAARCRILTPRDLLTQMETGFDLLESDRRDVAERHRSLDAAIEWSWRLLEPDTAEVFARSSVFPADYSFEAAAAVSGREPDAVLASIGELVDSSLLRVASDGSRTRYRFLESIRAFAASRLGASGAERETRDRALAWCVELGERTSREFDDETVIRKLTPELPNIRASLDHAIATGAAGSGAQLLLASAPLWETSHTREGIALVSRIAPLVESPEERARVLIFGSPMAANAGEVFLTGEWAKETVQVGRSLKDPYIIGAGLRFVAWATRWTGEPEEALAFFEEAIGLLEGPAPPPELVDCHTGIAEMAIWMGNADRATAETRVAVQLGRAGADRRVLVRALTFAGAVDHAQGRLPSAHRFLEEAIEIADRLDEQTFGGLARGWIARMGAYRGTFDESLALAKRVIDESTRAQLLFSALSGRWATAHLQYDSGDPDFDMEGVKAMAETFSLLRYPSFSAELLAVAASFERDRGNMEAAADLIRAAYEHARLVLGRVSLGRVLLVDASLIAGNGHNGEALTKVYEALDVMRGCGDRLGLVQGVEDAAVVIADRSPSFALQLLGAAASQRERLGAIVPPVRAPLLQSMVKRTTSSLGPDAAGEARRSGTDLDFDEALSLLTRRRRSVTRAVVSGWASLTPSEVAVAREIAAGRTTSEIAARLSVSPTTVKTHIAHVFDKLGVRTRAAVAALAAQQVNSAEAER